MSVINKNLLKKFECRFFKLSFVFLFFIFIFGYSPISKKAYAYDIYYIEDLYNIRYDLSGDHVLMNDLDFNSDSSYSDPANKISYTTKEGWDPIDGFLGMFDGNGYTISNLFVSTTSTSTNIGLFGDISVSSSVFDVGLLNTDISAINSNKVGSLVGSSDGTVVNCYSTGSVAGAIWVGGLVGENNLKGVVTHCYSSAVVDGSDDTGGLVGYNRGDVMNSYSTGNVTGNGNTGGLVGFSDNFGHIYKTYSTGQVLYFPSGSSGSAGGLVGLYEGMLALSDSFWDTETSGMGNSDGGIGKTTLEMQAIATFTNWDIVDISVFNMLKPSDWYIDEGNDYPRLFWEFEGYTPPDDGDNERDESPSGRPVFHPDRRCHWKKPGSPTWIKLEPMVKDGVSGMNLTWVQYDADKINIKIDDGTGKYPWKIEKTLNDGHEFLPNVASWQNIILKPINHCKEGEYSLAVSQLAYPYGWYGQSENKVALASNTLGYSTKSAVLGTSTESEETPSEETPMVPETGSSDILYLTTSLSIIGFSIYFVLNEKSRRFALREFERRVSRGL